MGSLGRHLLHVPLLITPRRRLPISRIDVLLIDPPSSSGSIQRPVHEIVMYGSLQHRAPLAIAIREHNVARLVRLPPLLRGNPLSSDRLVPDHGIDERLTSLPSQDMLNDEPPIRPALRRSCRCPRAPRGLVGTMLTVMPDFR